MLGLWRGHRLGNYPYFFVIVAVLPSIAALLIGLLLGWAIGALRAKHRAKT